MWHESATTDQRHEELPQLRLLVAYTCHVPTLPCFSSLPRTIHPIGLELETHSFTLQKFTDAAH